MNKKPLDMIRKQEAVYKQDYKEKDLSDTEWIKAMVENPKLINRPIIEIGNKTVWADPPENLDQII